MEIWLILSEIHQYFGKKSTADIEKEAALTCEKFTKVFLILFPKVNITRKMHIISFVLPRVIRQDRTLNMCYKLLQVEQAGERLHHIWNILIQSRFFAIKWL